MEILDAERTLRCSRRLSLRCLDSRAQLARAQTERMDRKRKWDEPAEGGAGAGAQSAEGDTPLKAVKTEDGASTRSASHEGGGGGGVDKAAEAAGQSPTRACEERRARTGSGVL